MGQLNVEISKKDLIKLYRKTANNLDIHLLVRNKATHLANKLESELQKSKGKEYENERIYL